MLELIVLGRIPGTTYQITFDWAIFAAGIFLLAIELYVLRHTLPVPAHQTVLPLQDPAESANIGGEDTLPVQLQLFQ
jgi:hypothetical protein